MHTTTDEPGAIAPASTPFSATELELLGKLYAGVPIRWLRQKYQLEPWDILGRHQHMPREQYHAVRRLLGLGPYVVRVPQAAVRGGECSP